MTGHVYKKKRPAGAEEERVIMHEGDASSSVTSESDHVDHATGARIPGHARNLRQKLNTFVHSTKFQILVVSLVIFNCLVVIVELLINLRIVGLGYSDRTAANVLHHINVGILGLFVTEMVIKIIAMDIRFVKHRMEVFDLVVVLVAFVLGLTLTNQTENAAHGVSLLIMLRLWRVTKILNSMVASVKQEADRRMAKERRARKALEREVYKLRDYCLQQECELQMYRMILHERGIPQPTVIRVPTAPRTLNVIAEVNEQQLLLDRENRRLGRAINLVNIETKVLQLQENFDENDARDSPSRRSNSPPAYAELSRSQSVESAVDSSTTV